MRFVPAENEARATLKEDFDRLGPDTKLAVSRAHLLNNASPVTGDNYYYQRCGNPTCEAVEVKICELEGGAATVTFNSGLTAATSVVMLLSAGDHLVSQTPIYGGTESFIRNMMQRWGLEVTWITAGENFCTEAKAAIRPNTKMLYMEVPCNPMMVVIDLASSTKMAKENGLLVAVDATFATPFLLQPIKYGADFVIHSCSKFIGGHSDLIAGCVTVANVEHWHLLKRHQRMTGSALSAFDASLVDRGLKTLPVRMRHICDSAMQIATFLSKHPKVKRVYYSGLATDPGHKFACKLMSANMFGGMISIDIESEAKAVLLVQSVRIFVLAVSLGGTESLIEYPIVMSRGRDLQKTNPLPEGNVRLSIGLEDAKDLIADLEQALAKI